MDKVNQQRLWEQPGSWLRSLALALLVLGSAAAAKANADETSAIAKADALQYGHRFAEALQVLDTVLVQEPGHLQARLMQARIHLAQGSLDAAQQSCQALLGQVSMTIAATCLLEVAGRMHPERLTETYTQLRQLYQQQSAAPDIRHWQQQILAEQAFELADYAAVTQWLSERSFAEQPAVNQKMLVDAWLANEQASRVLAQYSQCPQVGNLPEDSITVRLAHAEQIASAVSQCWQQLALERMQIRVAREDALHTADIAYFYAYVEEDAARALYYAEQNYDVAKEPADQRLLNGAQTLADKLSRQ